MRPWTIVACAGLAVAPSASRTAIAGDLNPPPGAIAPTMKPLDALLPGVCLEDLSGDEGATRIISQPGTYVLTQDLLGENAKDGIRVNCDAFPQGEHTVTIDLQGHTLRGVPGAANAIFVHNSDPTNRRVHVNIRGSVRDSLGPPAALITGWSIDGVHVEGATSVSLSGVRVVGCLDDGFEATNAPALGTSISCYTCVFETCGVDGVRVTLPAGGASSLEFQEVECLNNIGHGARVLYAGAPGVSGRTRIRMASMDASGNGLDGVRLGIGDESISYDFDDLHTARNGGHGTRMSVDRTQSRSMSADFHRCSSSGNGGDGYHFSIVNDSVNSGNNLNWNFCSASGNGGNGFFVASINAVPLRGTLYQCSATRNAGHGGRLESLDASIDLCDLSANTGSGLSATNSSVRCHDGSCRSNGASGISLTDNTGSRRASIDAMRCDDNGADGVSSTGLASLHVSDSSCASNGRGVGGGGGLLCGNTDHFICDASSFEDNAENGISLSVCGDVTVSGTLVLRNGTGPVGGSGIAADNVIQCECNHLIANGNTGGGAVFVQCASIRVASCDFSDNDLDGLSCGFGTSVAMSSSSCRGNLGNGVTVSDLNGDGMLDAVVCADNGGHGVQISDFGLSRVVSLSRCICPSNTGNGIHITNTLGLPCGRAVVSSCSTSANTGTGLNIDCSTGSQVRRCESSNNGGAGFSVAGTGHVVIENSASNNTGGSFLIQPQGNSLGPLIDDTLLPTNTNPAANYVR